MTLLLCYLMECWRVSLCQETDSYSQFRGNEIFGISALYVCKCAFTSLQKSFAWVRCIRCAFTYGRDIEEPVHLLESLFIQSFCIPLSIFLFLSLLFRSREKRYRSTPIVREKHWGAPPFTEFFIHLIVLRTSVWLCLPVSLSLIFARERSLSYNLFLTCSLSLSRSLILLQFCALALSLLRFPFPCVCLSPSQSYIVPLSRTLLPFPSFIL